MVEGFGLLLSDKSNLIQSPNLIYAKIFFSSLNFTRNWFFVPELFYQKKKKMVIHSMVKGFFFLPFLPTHFVIYFTKTHLIKHNLLSNTPFSHSTRPPLIGPLLSSLSLSLSTTPFWSHAKKKKKILGEKYYCYYYCYC